MASLFTFDDDLFKTENTSLEFQEKNFNGARELWGSYLDNKNYKDIDVLMRDKKRALKKLIKSMLRKKESLKIQITLLVRF